MNQAILSRSSSVDVAAGGRESLKSVNGGVVTQSRMTTSRVIGALFLTGFLVYGMGGMLVSSVTGAPDFLTTIAAHQTILVLGAFLMVLNTAVDVGKGVLSFPILERHGKRTALAYLATMVVEVVLLDIGALALLMIVPLSSQHGLDAGVANVLGSLAVQSNAMAYQIAEMALGVGCVFLCALLFRTRLISRFLSLAGLIGDHSNVRNPYQAEAFAREERGVSSPWSRTTTRSPPRLGYRRRWSGKRNGGTVPPSA